MLHGHEVLRTSKAWLKIYYRHIRSDVPYVAGLDCHCRYFRGATNDITAPKRQLFFFVFRYVSPYRRISMLHKSCIIVTSVFVLCTVPIYVLYDFPSRCLKWFDDEWLHLSMALLKNLLYSLCCFANYVWLWITMAENVSFPTVLAEVLCQVFKNKSSWRLRPRL